MSGIVRFIATAVACFVIYLLLSLPLSPGELPAGIGIAVLISILMSRYLPINGKLFNPVRIIRFLIYLPVFIRKMIAANLQIAAIVIRPKLAVSPAIVKGKTGLATKEGKLFLTSSITLTPGTLTVDVNEDDVFIHVVKKGKAEDPEKDILGPFEKHIGGITE